MRRMRSKQVVLSSTFLALPAMIALAGCASPDDVQYCGDEHRYVIEEKRCEDGSSGSFIYYGYWSNTAKPGQQLDSGGLKGRVVANDPAARTKVGLPARGGFGGNGAKFGGGGSS